MDGSFFGPMKDVYILTYVLHLPCSLVASLIKPTEMSANKCISVYVIPAVGNAVSISCWFLFLLYVYIL